MRIKILIAPSLVAGTTGQEQGRQGQRVRRNPMVVLLLVQLPFLKPFTLGNPS